VCVYIYIRMYMKFAGLAEQLLGPGGSQVSSLCVYAFVCIYMHIHMCACVCIYIYIYIGIYMKFAGLAEQLLGHTKTYTQARAYTHLYIHRCNSRSN
jgi:hypothetical protein